jgi:hypothetical protein
VLEAFTQTDASQQCARTRARVSDGHTRNAQRHFSVFDCGELWQEMVKLKDEANVPVSECHQLRI